VAFDSDQNQGGTGFRLTYAIEGAPMKEIEQTVEQAKDDLQALADYYIDPNDRPEKSKRIKKKMNNLFTKFISRMDKCGALNTVSLGIDLSFENEKFHIASLGKPRLGLNLV